ncbi:hypothetical protein [Bremerella cremea]|uniref:hypothetical protein n=1 Tax=Bremerella cremea TaxID=1031537 RepID=UPI0031EBD854
MKWSHALFVAVVLLFGAYALVDRTADVVNGPGGVNPEQHDTLRKRIVRVLANWLVDRNMQDSGPPAEQSPRPFLSHAPAQAPDEFLMQAGAPLDHSEGW